MKTLRALVAAMLVSTSALAQSQDVVSAEALFIQGRDLMQQGKFAQACPKFAASQRLDPAVGTLLNLGDCYEKNGQIASAWARFREAAALAASSGQKEREQIARGRAAALESKLARLTITAAVKVPQGGEVKLDGAVVAPETLDVPFPVDPGDHTIEVVAPGKRTFTTRVTVASAARSQVDLPALEDAPESPPSAVKPAPVTPATPPTNVREQPPGSGGSTQRTLAIVSLGVGVVGLGAGAVLGLMSKNKWDDAKKGCTAAGCPTDSVKAGEDAGTLADMSTVGFVVGGVGVVAAAVLWLTAPSAQPAITISSNGAGLGGRF